MSLRVGFLGVAHMHALGYAHALAARSDAMLAAVLDPEYGEGFRAAAASSGIEVPLPAGDEEFFDRVDAVIVCSENVRHLEGIRKCLVAGKPVLCEKPLVTSEEQARDLAAMMGQATVPVMTAFPCAYSPAFARAVERVGRGEIGEVLAVCATNRGQCPFGWFVKRELSGGGAIMDHTVHVADLLFRLLGREPERVVARAGHALYGQEWEDSGLLVLDYGGGVFATLDTSWSRPAAFRTWGDVTMTLVGSEGVIELDLFAQEIDRYAPGERTHTVLGFGSSLDRLLVEDFLRVVRGGGAPVSDWRDGLRAARVAFAAYESVRTGEPASVVPTDS